MTLTPSGMLAAGNSSKGAWVFKTRLLPPPVVIPLILSKALTQYKKLDNQGKVILSTNEYAPISKRISQYELNTNSTNEEKAYSLNAKNKYVLVTELIEK